MNVDITLPKTAEIKEDFPQPTLPHTPNNCPCIKHKAQVSDPFIYIEYVSLLPPVKIAKTFVLILKSTKTKTMYSGASLIRTPLFPR